MSDVINYKNNPLHGVSLKSVVTEIVEHYGFEILFAYLNINCFKNNPSIDSSVKFLKKTEWAREKVEAFYLYQYKSLPRASDEQFALPPRDRIVPSHQTPGAPAELSLEDAARLQEKRAQKAAERSPGSGRRAESGRRSEPGRRAEPNRGSAPRRDAQGSATAQAPAEGKIDPWAKWRK